MSTPFGHPPFLESVLFISARPTPQRIPTVDRLITRGIPVRSVYLTASVESRGWGELPVTHDHQVWDQMSPRAKVELLLDILNYRYSAIVVFGTRGVPRVFALASSRLSRRRRVFVRTDSNIDGVAVGGRLRRYLRRYWMRLVVPSDAVIWAIGTSNARFWREEVRRVNIEQIPYETPELPGGRDASDTSVRLSDPRQMRVVFVGRLVALKNVPDLINAFGRLEGDRYQRWTLEVVGDGPDADAVRAVAASDSRVRFAGSCDYEGLREVYERSDVLVLPSQHEAWGLVVNEALGFGLFVIASDQVGAARDLLVDRPEVGAVFPVGDVGALAEALRGCEEHLIRKPLVAGTDTAQLMADSLRRHCP